MRSRSSATAGSKRIDRLVHDIVESSEGVDDIRQSAEVGEAMLSLRAFMFERVYLGRRPRPNTRRRTRRSARSSTTSSSAATTSDEVVDYIAGMTDRFALCYADSV